MEILPLFNALVANDMSMNVLYYPILIMTLIFVSSKFFVRLDKYNLKILELENKLTNLESKTTVRVNRVESQVEKIEALVKEVASTVNNQHQIMNVALENIRSEYKEINTRLSHIERSRSQ